MKKRIETRIYETIFPKEQSKEARIIEELSSRKRRWETTMYETISPIKPSREAGI